MSPSDPVSYAMRQESWIPPQHSQVVSYWMHNIFFFIPVPPCLFWLVGRGNHFWLCAILFLVREYWPPGTYTGCPRRNVPDFRRVFLMLKYTDITQNNYVQSWTVTEIMAREKCGLLAGPRTVPVSWQVLSMFVLECGVLWLKVRSH